MINTTYKIILQNTKASLQHTGIQYTVKIIGKSREMSVMTSALT